MPESTDLAQIQLAERLTRQWAGKLVRTERVIVEEERAQWGLTDDEWEPGYLFGGVTRVSHFEVRDGQIWIVGDEHGWVIDPRTLIRVEPGDYEPARGGLTPGPDLDPSRQRAVAFLRGLLDAWERGGGEPEWFYVVRVERWDGRLDGDDLVFETASFAFENDYDAALRSYSAWQATAHQAPTLVHAVELWEMPNLPMVKVEVDRDQA